MTKQPVTRTLETTVYKSIGEYEKARKSLKNALAIKKEIGDRSGEATCYVRLGTVYQSVAEYEKTREHFEKALLIKKEIGDRRGEATCYGNLETCINHLQNMRRLENISRKHLRS